MSEAIWKRNPARQRRSFVNKAALRVYREDTAFRLGISAIERLLLRREQELGREMLLSEVETACDRVDFGDVVAFIKGQES